MGLLRHHRVTPGSATRCAFGCTSVSRWRRAAARPRCSGRARSPTRSRTARVTRTPAAASPVLGRHPFSLEPCSPSYPTATRRTPANRGTNSTPLAAARHAIAPPRSKQAARHDCASITDLASRLDINRRRRSVESTARAGRTSRRSSMHTATRRSLPGRESVTRDLSRRAASRPPPHPIPNAA